MDNEVAGGANWIDSETFDVLAKPEGPPAPIGERGAMMRKGGPYRLMVRSLLADRFQLKTHIEPRELSVFDLVVAKRGFLLKAATDNKGMRLGPGMIGGQISLDTLAQVLTRQVGRIVNNRTSLNGTFDLTLHYEPVTAGALNTDGSATSTDKPSIFTAIDTQLGLKLEPRKEMVEVLMIDNIQSPSGN
jgi:bla regulator protein BlaR1